MGGLDMGQTAQHGTIFGYAYLGVGCSGVPVPGGQPWQRSITFVPVALDETAHLVNSRSSVTVTPDAEGYFEAVLWAGAWRAEFADGTSFPFPVVAGTSERLVDLRGYVPPPGTTVQVVALAGVDVETLEPDDPATGEWRVDRLELGLPRGNQGDKGDAATISVGSTTTGAPGTPADVTNSGDSHNAVCHFTIPAGHDGREVEFGLSATHVQWRYVGDVAWMDLIALSSLVGATGAQGPKGDKGDLPPLPTITADDTPAAPAEGESASYLVTSAVTWPAGLVWSTDPDGGVAPTITGTALVSMFTVDGVTRAIMGATFPGVVVPDTTAPAPGTLASSSITSSGFTLTVTGASDAGAGLHATPYRFSTDNGATYSAWQAAASLAVTDKTASTAYQCIHQVRDAAATPNVATGAAITVTTTAAPPPGTLTYQSAQSTATAQSSYTFTGLAAGSASSARSVIVAVSQYNANPAVTTSSVTIGGIAAVKDVGTSSTNRVSELWRATVPTGTTVDVVVTLSASAGRCAVAVYSADTALTVTAIGNGSAANGDMSATVATTAGGHVIAVTSIHNADTTSAVTWGAVTHNHLSPLMGSSPYGGRMATASATGSGASITATATWTPTAAKLYGVLAVASYATA